MKIKALALLLALFAVLSLVACDFGKSNTIVNVTDGETDKQTEAGNETDEQTKLETETDIKTETNKETETATETAVESNTETESETETDNGETPDVEIPTITIAEALALCGEPGNITTERYYIKGIIKTVSNAEYGSMVITDATGEIAVYGTYSADGELRYSELDEKPYKGDEVLLHCILQNYSGTKEVKNARLISFVSNQGNVDISEYKDVTIAEARDFSAGAKLKVSGIVARITYANGMKPSGFILVNGADSIYVYDGDAAARVSIGNKVELAGSKTYWILDSEQSNAAIFGYKGCNQLEDVTLISNDGGNNSWINDAIPTSTVKDIIDTPVTEDITTQIFKVKALIKKAPGNGFVNYYINDLDEKTGSYTYTQCNGSDFEWLDEFDGKICTVYLVAINAKSTKTSCTFRLLPVAVELEQFTFSDFDVPEHAVKYYGLNQFAASYSGDPALELVTSVSSQLLGFENATLVYNSSDESVLSFTTVDGKTVMNCHKSGVVNVTVTAEYGEYSCTDTVEIVVDIPEAEIPSISVGEAINSEVGEIVTVKGIVGPSLVNQSGFYLIDEAGVIAVCMSEEEIAKVALGNEIILSGTRAVRTKGGTTYFGQTNLDACTILVNNYGSHEYSTASFITDKDLAYVYGLDPKEDHGTDVFVLTASVKVVETTYYTNIYITSGSTELQLYCSSASQYNWLKEFAGQEVTIEVAACNWNDKTYYRGCVLAVRTADGKVCNTLNFNK